MDKAKNGYGKDGTQPAGAGVNKVPAPDNDYLNRNRDADGDFDGGRSRDKGPAPMPESCPQPPLHQRFPGRGGR